MNIMIKYYREIYSNLLFITFIFLIINMRPGIIGQGVGLIYYILTFGITLLLFVETGKRIDFSNSIYLNYIILIILWIEIDVLYFGMNNINSVLGFLFSLIISAVLFICLDEKRWHMALNLLLWIIVVTTISQIFTMLMYFQIKNLTLLKIAEYQMSMGLNKTYEFEILFPFSITFSKFLNSPKLPRFTGFMREPGIYQIYIIISFYYQTSFKKKNYLLEFILIIGLLMTYSSIGYLIFLFTYPYYLFIHQKRKLFSKYNVFILPAIAIILYYFITTKNKVGLLKKLSTKSGMGRIDAIIGFFNSIREWNFWGDGLYSINPDVYGVSMIGMLPQIGLFGFIVISLPFLYIFYKTFKINSILSIFTFTIYISLIFAQPLFDKALTFYFLSIIFYGYNLEYHKKEKLFGAFTKI